MPNWTSNEVRFISENKSALKRLKLKLKGKEVIQTFLIGQPPKKIDNVFDFNNIKPMPKALRNTVSPTPTDTQEEKNKAMALKIRYGYSNWYDWCNANWGTKWNSCEAQSWDEEGAVVYKFDTAWSAPNRIAIIIDKWIKENIHEDIKVDYWIANHECELETEKVL